MRMIFPVLAQIAWTFVVLVMMGRARAASVTAREVKIADIALGGDAWPPKVKAISNNYTNQFETPLLFYVLCAAAIYVGQTGWIAAALAWAFVALRVAHTLVHAGSNHVPTRFRVFLASTCVLIALWLMVAWKALFG
jgi:hypothetical protein